MEIKRSLLLFLWSIVSSCFLQSVTAGISSGSPTIILAKYTKKGRSKGQQQLPRDRERVAIFRLPAKCARKFVMELSMRSGKYHTY